MPLEKIKNISEDKIIGIWNITEDLEMLMGQVNAGVEDGSFGKITSKNKLKEWCAVRLTAEALSYYMKIEYQGIYKDDYGKPHLNESDVHLSISHSYPYVALIMDRQQDTGIDIEFLEPRILRLTHKFMSGEELRFSGGDLLTSGLIWSAKESLYKLHGRKRLLFSEQLLIDPFDPKKNSKFYGKIIDGDIEKHELGYEFIQKINLIYVYTLSRTQ